VSVPVRVAARPDLNRVAWALVAAAVAGQVAYPLVEGHARDRLTVATVLVTFAAVCCHAAGRFGARGATALMGLTLAVAAGTEILGVHTGFPFGDYSYGGGLGPELGGVPLVIPAAWAMTAYPALLVARRLTARLTGRHGPAATALVGGWALASWDVFLDPQMVEEGYWRWVDPDPSLPGSPDVPLTNYVGWLVVSVLLLAALDRIVSRDPNLTDPPDRLPGLLYLWTYAAQVLANFVFFDRPAVALLGGLAMGVVAVPYARTLRAHA
jgi:putative membrane protein